MAFITPSNFISAPLVCFFLSANEKQYQNFGKPPLEITKLEDSRARAVSESKKMGKRDYSYCYFLLHNKSDYTGME